MVSPETVTVWGKRPCTLSKRNKWALVSTGQIVDGNDFDVFAPTLENRAQHVAANAAKTVDRDLHSHVLSSGKEW